MGKVSVIGFSGPIRARYAKQAALNRRYRLSDSGRFRQVRQAGTSFSHPFFVLSLLPNELDVSRCGFTASRRIGNAVARNRARRRMREVVRHLWLTIQPGWDLVWVARPAINRAEFADLEAAGAHLLGRAGVLRPRADVGHSAQED